MADNFNENQLNLITSTTSDITFVEQQGDYIQVTVLNQNGDVINLDGDLPAIFQSNISSIDGLLLQYQDGLPGRFTIDENGDVLTLALFEELTPGVRLIALDTKEIVFEREKDSLVVINFKNQIIERNK